MKGLKSTRAPAMAPEEMLRVAGVAAPRQPPAVVSVGSGKSVMISIRMTEQTAEALAACAIEHGVTQRRLVAEALAARGVAVAPRDLEDRPLPRRRGAR
ncbi:MAG TPA: hypothetical protein VJ779_12135 [Acetobacteraceae bacterium]|nr:hypothetical protein [Acetobacteraceae bacterium]